METPNESDFTEWDGYNWLDVNQGEKPQYEPFVNMLRTKGKMVSKTYHVEEREYKGIKFKIIDSGFIGLAVMCFDLRRFLKEVE